MSSACPVKSYPKESSPASIDKPAASNSDSSSTSCSYANNNASQGYNPLVNDEIFGQDRQMDQKATLSTRRSVSTIPKGDFSPHHQIASLDTWVYPSEQQYYNAMRRKGYNPSEQDIPVALRIHNMVNEEGWRKVKEWELIRANTSPVLKKFVGRPKDISPKARFLNLIG
jgi:cytochrome c heme-lyase